MTRAQRVNYLASTAGLLATTFGEVFVTPAGKGAVSWSSGPLRAILWADGEEARVDLFNHGRRVMATAWRPGGTHEALTFRRGAWEQALVTAGRAMVEGLGQDGGAAH